MLFQYSLFVVISLPIHRGIIYRFRRLLLKKSNTYWCGIESDKPRRTLLPFSWKIKRKMVTVLSNPCNHSCLLVWYHIKSKCPTVKMKSLFTPFLNKLYCLCLNSWYVLFNVVFSKKFLTNVNKTISVVSRLLMGRIVPNTTAFNVYFLENVRLTLRWL